VVLGIVVHLAEHDDVGVARELDELRQGGVRGLRVERGDGMQDRHEQGAQTKAPAPIRPAS
jgi:hypothetical protein